MTKREAVNKVGTMLDKTGVPVRYYKFKTPVDLPFILYYIDDRRDFYADDLNYVKVYDFLIEVYTSDDHYDFELQDKVEEILEDHGFSYYTLVNEIPDERMIQFVYYITLK